MINNYKNEEKKFMTLHKNKIITLLFASFLFSIMLLGSNSTNVNAKYKGHYSMPTELRGTWHKVTINKDPINGSYKSFSTLKITNKEIFHNGTMEYQTGVKDSGTKIYVVRSKHYHDGTNYLINKAGDLHYRLSKKRINGKRVLIINNKLVWTKGRSNKQYTYSHGRIISKNTNGYKTINQKF